MVDEDEVELLLSRKYQEEVASKDLCLHYTENAGHLSFKLLMSYPRL